jgi:hypothetical protein
MRVYTKTKLYSYYGFVGSTLRVLHKKKSFEGLRSCPIFVGSSLRLLYSVTVQPNLGCVAALPFIQ